MFALLKPPSCRYLISEVGNEVSSNRRGWSIVAWFIFMVIFDIKLYFVHQHIWKTCLSQTPPCGSSYENTIKSFDSNETDAKENEISMKSIETPKIECDYSLPGKKLLVVFQAIILSGLYLALVGADYMADLKDFRQLEEVKMRMFWVVMDIHDILQLQSSMWDSSFYQFSFHSACVIYFYCYIALIVLPSISLAELSKHKGKLNPHKLIFYMIASILFVNIGTSIIRSLLLFYFQFNSTSTIFMAKNIVCLGLQVKKFDT